MKIALTDREADLMDLLWEHGPSTVAEVRDRLGDDLAYTTVLTILRTLESKGFIHHDPDGRAHRYYALVARDVARQSALNALSKKLFKGSTELLLTHLVSDRKLSDAQLARIKELLEQRTKKERT
jgi:predicted transcriptional regulator